MNRFFLVTLLASLSLAACGKGADSPAREAEGAKPADTIRMADKPADPRVAPATGTTTQGDVTGSYTALGTLPAPFAEIDHLLLANIDADANPAPLNGFLRPKEMKAADYVLVDPRLEGKNLSFTTIDVKGVSYAFKGTFARLDSFAVNPPPFDAPILSGTLTRMKGGVMEAETKVDFAYAPGD